jgi:helix-turn-helix protein
MTGIPVDPYVFDTLMADLVGHDRQPTAFLVYLHLWRRAGGKLTRRVAASYQQMAVEIGVSRSAVQAATATLVRRKLLKVESSSATAIPEYTVLRPWIRRPAEPRTSAAR